MAVTPEQDRIWKAIEEEVERLPRGNGSSRSAAVWGEYDGEVVGVVVYWYLASDGTRVTYTITGTHVPNGCPEVIVSDPETDSMDKNWAPFLDMLEDGKSVIVDHQHYRIGPETSDPRDRGFGGRKFTIRFHDGREVTTTNLWYQGMIPPTWRDRLPDNAIFVNEKEGTES